MQYLDAISKMTEWSLFVSRQTIQYHSNPCLYLNHYTEEAEVEQLYEDLQDLLELTPKKDVLFIIGAAAAAKSLQSCPTLCNPMDCSPQGSSVHGIFQARVLEWVTISFSRGSSQARDQTRVACIAGRHFTVWATREAHLIWPYIHIYIYIYIHIHTYIHMHCWHLLSKIPLVFKPEHGDSLITLSYLHLYDPFNILLNRVNDSCFQGTSYPHTYLLTY